MVFKTTVWVCSHETDICVYFLWQIERERYTTRWYSTYTIPSHSALTQTSSISIHTSLYLSVMLNSLSLYRIQIACHMCRQEDRKRAHIVLKEKKNRKGKIVRRWMGLATAVVASFASCVSSIVRVAPFIACCCFRLWIGIYIIMGMFIYDVWTIRAIK